jgi:hypothetical protein
MHVGKRFSACWRRVNIARKKGTRRARCNLIDSSHLTLGVRCLVMRNKRQMEVKMQFWRRALQMQLLLYLGVNLKQHIKVKPVENVQICGCILKIDTHND